jgi:hypothetical protein
VRLQEMRDALATPVDGIERNAHGQFIALDQGDLVTGSTQR